MVEVEIKDERWQNTGQQPRHPSGNYRVSPRSRHSNVAPASASDPMVLSLFVACCNYQRDLQGLGMVYWW